MVLDWKKIKLLILDVDGVLTDGSLYYSQVGEELKVFNVKDGTGITRLLKAGIKVAVISGEVGLFTELRLKKLGVGLIYLGVKDKIKAYEELKLRTQIGEENTVYVGDDLIDIPVLKRVAIGVAVEDAVAEVKAIANYITQRPGGRGAVREVADLILYAE